MIDEFLMKDYVVNSVELEREILQYSVGALLYTPAVNVSIADNVIDSKFDNLMSIAFCLEDAIDDQFVEFAEEQLLKTIAKISNAHINGKLNKLPLIFIRVRSANQIEQLFTRLGNDAYVITGFILPKFDLSNAEEYKKAIIELNNKSEKTIYIMPIIESKSFIDLEFRVGKLKKLKSLIDSIKIYVLNIRVGGNDLCNNYGLRRNYSNTIYDISIIKDILVSILNVFAKDFVVSGPVWEYFDNNTTNDWLNGLKREIELDKTNGFIGKTAIHPSQVSVIVNSMKVESNDFADAKAILNWNNAVLSVAKSSSGQRMNESKVHLNWAKKTIMLAQIYGVIREK